jgi:hypothetical protein
MTSLATPCSTCLWRTHAKFVAREATSQPIYHGRSILTASARVRSVLLTSQYACPLTSGKCERLSARRVINPGNGERG